MTDNNDYNDPNVVQNIQEIFFLIMDSEETDIYIDAISEILDEGNVDINTKYDHDHLGWQGGPGWTNDDWDNFLKIAVKMSNTVLVQELLDRGININITDREGLTPLDISNREFIDFSLTPYGLQIWTDTRNILLQNGAMTSDQLEYIRRMQRRRRKNITHRRAKRNLAYSKSFIDQTMRRKPERLSELAPDILKDISKYM